jgi:hypothetical protein
MTSTLLEILKISLGLVGALVGAFIGTRLSLDRFKRERGYDKRLEWHLETLKILDGIGIGYALSQRRPEHPAPESLTVIRRFARIATESEAFSWHDSAVRVRKAYEDYRQVDDEARSGSALNEIGRRKEAIYRAHSAISNDLKRLLPALDP